MKAQSKSAAWGVWGAVILSWAGLLVSFLLIQASAGGGARICPLGGGCQAVLSSAFSSMLGIPLPWLGALFYAGLFLVSLLTLGSASSFWRKRMASVALYGSILGVTFTAGLMYLQFFVIRAICPLCTASAAIQLGLLASLISAAQADFDRFPSAPDAALAIVTVAILGMAGMSWLILGARQDSLAVVGDQKWLRSEMDRDLRFQIWPLKREILDLQTQWIRKKSDAALIAREARKRGVSESELLAEFSRDQQAFDALRRDFLARSSWLQAPEGPIAFTYEESMITGPADALVEVVVFSDFTCKFCIELDGVMRRVRREFPQIKIVHVDFPLAPVGLGFEAAVAAKCAAEQGAFWKYQDRLFDQRGLLQGKFLEIAQELHLDVPRFEQCARSETTRRSVREGWDEAIAIGVPGVPAVFIDGMLMNGKIGYVEIRRAVMAALSGSSKAAEK